MLVRGELLSFCTNHFFSWLIPCICLLLLWLGHERHICVFLVSSPAMKRSPFVNIHSVLVLLALSRSRTPFYCALLSRSRMPPRDTFSSLRKLRRGIGRLCAIIRVVMEELLIQIFFSFMPFFHVLSWIGCHSIPIPLEHKTKLLLYPQPHPSFSLPFPPRSCFLPRSHSSAKTPAAWNNYLLRLFLKHAPISRKHGIAFLLSRSLTLLAFFSSLFQPTIITSVFLNVLFFYIASFASHNNITLTKSHYVQPRRKYRHPKD